MLPLPDEQAAIVRFLGWANGRLERTIQAKRKVIALLTEQKQGIIHRAVTRGLDSSVPLKPSGIPWLGGIPQHWEVRRLRTLVHRIDQGVSPLAVGFLAEGNSWGVLKSGCVNRGVFRETEHKQLARGFKIDPAIVVKVGDVLISRACGSPSLVGSVGRVKALRYRLILSDKTFRALFRNSCLKTPAPGSLLLHSHRPRMFHWLMSSGLPWRSQCRMAFSLESLDALAKHMRRMLMRAKPCLEFVERLSTSSLMARGRALFVVICSS